MTQRAVKSVFACYVSVFAYLDNVWLVLTQKPVRIIVYWLVLTVLR